MDIKMGTRTYLETEASVQKPREDLFLKMVAQDPKVKRYLASKRLSVLNAILTINQSKCKVCQLTIQ